MTWSSRRSANTTRRVTDVDDETFAALRARWDAEKAAIEACEIHARVGDELVPLNACDWVLTSPSGAVVTIMSAVTAEAVYATAADAWHEMYDTAPHPHKRERERAIKRMILQGYTLRLMRSEDAIEAHLEHVQGNRKRKRRTVADVPDVDTYEEEHEQTGDGNGVPDTA